MMLFGSLIRIFCLQTVISHTSHSKLKWYGVTLFLLYGHSVTVKFNNVVMHTRWNGCDVVKWIFRCHAEHSSLFEHVLLNIVAGLIMSYTKTKFFVHFKCGEVQNDVRILWSVGECKHHAIKWLIIYICNL